MDVSLDLPPQHFEVKETAPFGVIAAKNFTVWHPL